MLGVIYLILCFATGCVICHFAFPGLKDSACRTFKGNDTGLSSIFLLVPAWFISGTLLLTWLVYILSCLFKDNEIPMLHANEIVMIIAVAVCAVSLYMMMRSKPTGLIGEIKKIRIPEAVAFALFTALVLFLMYTTFYVRNNNLHIGLSVFSDFTPHVSMIRSFSYGDNFPTQYSVFAGEDVKYHFMFQFLVGNLEFLGLRIDHAFNIASALSMLCVYSLLYVLAVKITGKKTAGLLCCLLFTFRSSSAIFHFLSEVPEGTGIIEALNNNTEFIGYSTNENWGLWNLNVYCNQRHFAFSLSVMLFVLINFLPQLYLAGERLSALLASKDDNKPSMLYCIKLFFRESLLNKEGWLPKNIREAIVSGIILGAIGFWNGAVLIATVLILFFIAVAADRRLEYLIMAVIAGALSLLQTNIFIDSNAFGLKYTYGFIAENKTLFGAIDYIIRLMGILPFVLLIVFAVSKGTRKYLMICFSMPIIMSFTISLTPDVTVNHKYIMISVMLLNIFAASFIVLLFKNRNAVIKALCILLVVCLTATGIYDFTIVARKNTDERNISYPLDDEIVSWISNNTDSEDIFLTSNIYLNYSGKSNSILLSGAMLYQAWQYFAWSAGYDTSGRDDRVAAIYGATERETLKKLVQQENIAFIVIDASNRLTEEYDLNEAIFDSTYKKVFCSGEGNAMISIYDTSVILQ